MVLCRGFSTTFPSPVRGLSKSHSPACRALKPPLKPPFVASRIIWALTLDLGHSVLPSEIISNHSDLRASGCKNTIAKTRFSHIFRKVCVKITILVLKISKTEVIILQLLVFSKRFDQNLGHFDINLNYLRHHIQHQGLNLKKKYSTTGTI